MSDATSETDTTGNGGSGQDADIMDRLIDTSIHRPLVEDPEYGDFSDEARAERRSKNLEMLDEVEPGLARALRAYKPAAEVVFDDDGSPDIQLGTKKVYGHPVRDYNARQYEAFWANPHRITMSPVQPAHLDRQASEALSKIMVEIKDAGIELHKYPETRTSFHLMVLGIGLGLHAERLILETKCHYAVFIEPNLEFLYHSMEFTDWWRLHGIIKERGGRLLFLIDRTPEGIDRTVRNTVRYSSPVAFDGMTFYPHFGLPIFDRAMKMMMDRANLTLNGFGFVDDEFYMIRHTYGNLLGGQSRLTQRTGVGVQPCPLFLVGNGPSLDNDLDFIRENQDKAIIFSCGTAVRPLCAAGIKPDLHLEIERNIEIMPLVQQPADEFDFSDVTLVASSTVDPRMQSYFQRAVYFFRAALSCTPLFAPNEECQPTGAGPTVVNGALGVAQDVGFREIYFFGVDMGTKRRGVYHSTKSWQHTQDGFEMDIVYETPAPGNFGGTVFTHDGLTWAADEIENAIRTWGRGRFYYNCSDGMKIKGAKACRPRSIKFKDLAPLGGKKQILENLWNTFPVYTQEMLDEKWDSDAIMAEIDAYLDRIIDCINDNPNLPDNDYVCQLQQIYVPPEFSRNVIWGHIFRGTALMLMVGIEYYLNRVRTKEDLAKATDIAREGLIGLIERMRADAKDELGQLATEAQLMRYVNRKDVTARSDKEIPEPLPIPDDLKPLFEEQEWAEELTAFYTDARDRKAKRLAERLAKQLKGEIDAGKPDTLANELAETKKSRAGG